MGQIDAFISRRPDAQPFASVTRATADGWHENIYTIGDKATPEGIRDACMRRGWDVPTEVRVYDWPAVEGVEP